MFCFTCGRELEEGFLYCDFCGAPVPQEKKQEKAEANDTQDQFFMPVNPVEDDSEQRNHRAEINDTAPTVIRCKNCYTVLPAGSKYCDHCGAIIDDGYKTASIVPEEPAPVADTQDSVKDVMHLVDKLALTTDTTEEEKSPGMIRCPKCGELIEDDSMFCELCGAKL